MKIKNLEIILDNMSAFEFWLFMGNPSQERWRILRKKTQKWRKLTQAKGDVGFAERPQRRVIGS